MTKEKTMKYVNVVVANNNTAVDSYFTYRKGEDDLNIGDRVEISFNRRDTYGYVFQFLDKTDYDEGKILKIKGTCPELSLTPEIVNTCIWMKKKYGIKYMDGINLFLPPSAISLKGKKKEPYKDILYSYSKPEKLTVEQEEAVSRINLKLEQGINEMFLFHGVTSGGKTEVYMEAIEKALKIGKSAIMLVPEISLTPQTLERFIGRFGKDKVAVLHSKLTKRERFDEWQRIRTGEAKIVVGARMGVFAPLENIGIIIMDEEHESTYKSEMHPRYDTVEVAAKRCQNHRGILLLGSATPSLISYNRYREGIYELLTLKERYNKQPLPEIEIVDMKKELREGNTSIISNHLYKEIRKTLDKGQQIILLQNRRGYSNFMYCKDCGHVIKCTDCDISMTYHKTYNGMVCHYCGKKQPVPMTCPCCKSKELKYYGIGTEQVIEWIQEYFKDVPVERLDLDTIKNRREMTAILNRFDKGKTKILVGTQLVAKGLDFKNVGLVGIISADATLNIPDFRSEERTFQLVTQVAGRAGRGSEKGRVIVQTYNPENMALLKAKDYDYEGFFYGESQIRKMLMYPPFGEIILVTVQGKERQQVVRVSHELIKYLKKYVKTQENLKIHEPKGSIATGDKELLKYFILIKLPNKLRNEIVFYIDRFSRQLVKDRSSTTVLMDINPNSIV